MPEAVLPMQILVVHVACRAGGSSDCGHSLRDCIAIRPPAYHILLRELHLTGSAPSRHQIGSMTWVIIVSLTAAQKVFLAVAKLA